MTTTKIVHALAVVVAIPFLLIGLNYADRLPLDESRFDTVLAARVELSARPVADGTIRLSWNLSNFGSEVIEYEYQKGPLGSSYGEWTPIVGPEEPRWTVGELTNGVLYNFRMKATDENNVEHLSNPAIAAPIAFDTPEEDVRPSNVICDGDELGTVLFDVGHDEIDDDFGSNRLSLLSIANGLPNEAVVSDAIVLVVGYASAEGSASYNLDLSERRAREVVLRLSGPQGFAGQLVPLAMGERHDELALDRDGEENQRVVVTLCGDQTQITASS